MKSRAQRMSAGWAGAALLACAAANAGSLRLAHDPAGRLTGADYGGGRAILWSLDGAGNTLTQAVAGAASAADLAMLVTSTPVSNELGRANLFYTLSVTNTGPSACPTLDLSMTIPASTLFAASSAGLVSNGVFRYARSDLGVGETAVVTVEAVPLAAGTVIGSPSVAASADPDTLNNAAACSNVVTAVTDANHNGLADWWEQQYIPNPADRVASLDLDHDGIPNDSESRAGTDPWSTTSALRIGGVTARTGSVAFSFPAQAGRVYRAQWSRMSGPFSWSNLVENVPGRAADLTLDDAAGYTSRVYRIEVTHPPAP